MKGVYSLVFRCEKQIKVGKIGRKKFDGSYCYIGSARGKGGLSSRIGRHLSLYNGNKDVRHWHIDYVLPHSDLIGYCYGKTKKDKECLLSQKIRYEKAFENFGSSDCKCLSHLHKIEDLDINELKKDFKKCGLNPSFNEVINDEKRKKR